MEHRQLIIDEAKLPEGWQEVNIGDVVSPMTTVNPKSRPDQFFEYIDVSSISRESLTIETTKLIKGSDAPSRARRRVQEGDVLFATIRPTLQRIAVVPKHLNGAVCSTGYYVLRPQVSALTLYLYYYLQSADFQGNMETLQRGASYPAVNDSDVKNQQIPIPPLSEQKRIVAILDEAFAAIDKATANTEKNLANARELFDSELNRVFSQKGEGWVEKRLGDDIDLLTGFAFKSKDYSISEKDVKLVRGDNIVQGRFRWKGVKRWSKADMDNYSKYLLDVDDVVLAMDRTWVKAGLKFSQVSSSDLPCLLVQRVARLRALNNLDSCFLAHLIGSPCFTQYVLSIQTGLGVPHISGPQIKAFSFYRPALEQQQSIVRVLNEIAKKTSKMVDLYNRKLAALAELKQSILQKAFTGELTADSAKDIEEAVQ